jgi:predicted DNA-binding ribbon-helix-helix protein
VLGDDIGVRTTLTLDDDIFRLVKSYAKARRLSLGEAVAELVCYGYQLSGALEV